MPSPFHRLAAILFLAALPCPAADTFASRFSGEWKSLQREISGLDHRLSSLPKIPAADSGTSRAFLRVFSPQQTNADRRIDFIIRIRWPQPEAVDLIAIVPARKIDALGVDFNYGFPEDFEVVLIRPDETPAPVAAFENISLHPALRGHPVVARPESPLDAIGVEIRITRTREPRKGAPVMAFLALSEVFCFSGENNLSAEALVEIVSPGINQTPSYWAPQLLIDGATPLGYPERPLPTGEPEFIGWVSQARTNPAVPLTITLDLGEEREIDGLRLFPALRPSAPPPLHRRLPRLRHPRTLPTHRVGFPRRNPPNPARPQRDQNTGSRPQPGRVPFPSRQGPSHPSGGHTPLETPRALPRVPGFQRNTNPQPGRNRQPRGEGDGAGVEESRLRARQTILVPRVPCRWPRPDRPVAPPAEMDRGTRPAPRP